MLPFQGLKMSTGEIPVTDTFYGILEGNKLHLSETGRSLKKTLPSKDDRPAFPEPELLQGAGEMARGGCWARRTPLPLCEYCRNKNTSFRQPRRHRTYPTMP